MEVSDPDVIRTLGFAEHLLGIKLPVLQDLQGISWGIKPSALQVLFGLYVHPSAVHVCSSSCIVV